MIERSQVIDLNSNSGDEERAEIGAWFQLESGHHKKGNDVPYLMKENGKYDESKFKQQIIHEYEEGSSGESQPENSGEQPIDAMIKNVFSERSQMEILRMIDHILSRSPLSVSTKYMTNQWHPSSQEIIDGDTLPSQIITCFIRDDQQIIKTGVIVTLVDSHFKEGKKQIIIQNLFGQVLMAADGCDVEDLPHRMIHILNRISDFIIIENSTSKTFQNLEYFPNVMTLDVPFIWVEDLQILQIQEATSGQITINDYNLKRGYHHTYRYFTPLKQNSWNLVENFEAMTHHARHLRHLVNQSFENVYPSAKSTVYSFLPSLVLNIELLKKNETSFPQQIDIYADLSYLLEKLIDDKQEETPDDVVNLQHFPQMLIYPKYCMACKENNTIFKIDSAKTNRKKTKYTCPACNKFFRTQIRLCVLCFKGFHVNMSQYMVNESFDFEDFPEERSENELPVVFYDGEDAEEEIEIKIEENKESIEELIELGHHESFKQSQYPDQLSEQILLQLEQTIRDLLWQQQQDP